MFKLLVSSILMANLATFCGPQEQTSSTSGMSKDSQDNTIHLSEEPVFWTGKIKTRADDSFYLAQNKYQQALEPGVQLGSREGSPYSFLFNDVGHICYVTDEVGRKTRRVAISISPKRDLEFFDYELSFRGRIDPQGRGVIFMRMNFEEGLYPPEDKNKTNSYLGKEHEDLVDSLVSRFEQCNIELSVFKKP